MLRHEHREEKEIQNESDSYSGQVGNYDVVVTQDRHFTRISIAPKEWSKDGGGRLGILQCHPKNVAGLEAFAKEAHDVLMGIAAELRAIGKDDLRGEHERQMDEMRARFDLL